MNSSFTNKWKVNKPVFKLNIVPKKVKLSVPRTPIELESAKERYERLMNERRARDKILIEEL